MRILSLLLPTILLLVPPAVIATNCGDVIIPSDYGPAMIASQYAESLWAYFTDEAPHCGIVEHHMYIDGREIFSSVEAPVGMYGVGGQDRDTPLFPGPHVVRAEIVEACCNSLGTSARGVVEWVMMVTSTAATGYAPWIHAAHGECTIYNDTNDNDYPEDEEALAQFPCPA